MNIIQYVSKTGGFASNCFFVVDMDQNCLVVDPGIEGDEIANHCKAQGWNVTHALVTHAHFDHIAGIAGLRAVFPKLLIVVSEKDDELLQDPAKNLAASFMQNPPLDVYSLKGDILVEDGQVLELNLFKIKVLATPYHTHGSVCYILENHIFTGDSLFYNSYGRSDFYSSEPSKIATTLSKFAAMDDDILVYPGHNECFHMGKNKIFLAGVLEWES